MNNGYKILIVEDKLDELAPTYCRLLWKWMPSSLTEREEEAKKLSKKVLAVERKLETSPGTTVVGGAPAPKEGYPKFDEEWKTALKNLPFVDISENTHEALNFLHKNAEQYLLILVDRDLGKIKWDKDIWPEFKEFQEEEEPYGGDLLLAYLLLKRGMVNECRERFRFFTHNATNQQEKLQRLLKTYYFPDDLINKMIVDKGGAGSAESDEYKELQAKIENPVCFHIQRKYSDVFAALGASAEDLSVDLPEHTQNLIKALAYVEGVKLEGQKLERPLISLLRALGEAFRAQVKGLATEKFNSWGDWNKTTVGYFGKIREKLDSSEDIIETGLLACMANKVSLDDKDKDKNNAHGGLFDVGRLSEVELFNPNTNPLGRNRTQKLKPDQIYKLKKYAEKYQHLSDVMEMVQHLTSQEIHHNDRPWGEGKRLELIVYGVCELLRFYHTNISKNTPIDLSGCKKRSAVFGLLEEMDKPDEWWGKLYANMEEQLGEN